MIPLPLRELMIPNQLHICVISLHKKSNTTPTNNKLITIYTCTCGGIHAHVRAFHYMYGHVYRCVTVIGSHSDKWDGRKQIN